MSTPPPHSCVTQTPTQSGASPPTRRCPGPRRPQPCALPRAPAGALTCRVRATGAGRERPRLPPARASPGPRARARTPGSCPRPAALGPRGRCSPPAPCSGCLRFRLPPSSVKAEGRRGEHARSHSPVPPELGSAAGWAGGSVRCPGYRKP